MGCVMNTLGLGSGKDRADVAMIRLSSLFDKNSDAFENLCLKPAELRGYSIFLLWGHHKSPTPNIVIGGKFLLMM